MAIFTVTSTSDVGPGTLREAVQDANALRGADTIVFDVEPGSVIRLVQGEIEILDTLTIDGDIDADGIPDIVITADAFNNDVVGSDGLTDIVASRDAGRLDDNSRVFFSDAITNLNGLVLTGGSFVSSSPRADGGGAISGGGGSYDSQNTLTITDSVISGNYAGGQNVQGGGIFQLLDDLVLVNTVVSDNLTTGAGGGIAGGGVELTSSTVAGNVSLRQGLDGGGGISASSVDLVSSTVIDNTAQGVGGGIDAGYVIATNTTVAGNFSGFRGGGINGGGIELTNSTVTGNGIYGRPGDGAGIYSFSYVRLSNAIVLGNVAGDAFDLVFEGDAIGTDGAPVEAQRSIIGTNPGIFDTSGLPGVRNAVPGDVFAELTEIALDFDGDGLLDTPSGFFGGLALDNGGQVDTVALAPTGRNPAIVQGDDDLFDLVGSVDARGRERFVDRDGVGADGPVGAGIIDLGAFEFDGEGGGGEVCPGTPIEAETAELLAFVYEALLNRDGGIDPGGFNFWIDALEGALPGQTVPLTLQGMVQEFFVSDEFIRNFGDVQSFTPREVVELFYRNILGREGDPGGIDFWTDVLTDSGLSNAEVLIEFADADENRDSLDITVVDNGDCTWSVDVVLV